MKSFGSTLFILGLLAFGLNYMNAVPKVLAWIYTWGEDTAMWIKAGITGGGALSCGLRGAVGIDRLHGGAGGL